MNYAEKYGPWALVVGASTGLGAAWAEECAKRGFNVMICARRLEKLQEVSAGLREKYGVETREFVADISKEEVVENILKEIEDIDLGMFIYNAAVEMSNQFIKMKEEHHIEQVIGNALVPMRLSWHIGRDMAKKHRGCILLLSSMSSVVGTSGQSSYSACKAFEVQLGETLWYELGKYGVDAAGVMVGAVVTPEFIRVQEAQGTNIGEGDSADISDCLEGLNIDPAVFGAKPHACDVVAAYVMDHIGDGPRLYTHPEDQAQNEAYYRMNRKDSTLLMSRITDKYFAAGNEWKETEDAGEFVEIKKM